MALTPVSILWSLLSIFVASTCTVTFFYPAWVTHPDRLHSFGVFRYCVRNLEILIPTPRCISYGGNPNLGRIPAGAWQASCILYGGGCILMCVSALLTVFVLCVDKPKHRRLALINGYLQTVAVLIMAAGLLMYPLGFSTPFFQYYCGEAAGPYSTGHCQIGWSYMLAIMGVSLSIFCPILSNFADVKYDEDDYLAFV
ncbi:LHFPL tetraspan subfamily member 2 protein-like [Haliotis asinina]|uniref:LHFPL tetraspan subfamily member 2 protein-like n=1 Tax=Haliotis asinina TaxID=109174 RepID=UPI003531E846